MRAFRRDVRARLQSADRAHRGTHRRRRRTCGVQRNGRVDGDRASSRAPSGHARRCAADHRNGDGARARGARIGGRHPGTESGTAKQERRSDDDRGEGARRDREGRRAADTGRAARSGTTVAIRPVPDGHAVFLARIDDRNGGGGRADGGVHHRCGQQLLQRVGADVQDERESRRLRAPARRSTLLRRLFSMAA